MALNILITGVTGYIGGDITHAVVERFPEYEYTFLVRNEERAKVVKAKYPKASYVYGSLDDGAVIEKAAAKADVVIHDVSSAETIAKGLEAGHSAERPGYWIHTSGTGILQYLCWLRCLIHDTLHSRTGQPPHPGDSYDDVADIFLITSFPQAASHRPIDALVQATARRNGAAVRTAIVCPPTIYGVGRGPGNTRSIQVPDLIKTSLKLGFVPFVGTGLTEWDQVHVADLADLYVRLLEKAVATVMGEEEHEEEVFGEKAYYFAEAGAHRWVDVAGWVADELTKQGYSSEPKTQSVDTDTAVKEGGPVAVTWGLNTKGFANRARKYLGWKPTRESLKESIPEAVNLEAKALGLEHTTARGHRLSMPSA
ncbi:hypothetical protein BD289DRAFT_451496 [Coniella lustricola]|uniref:NAD-dependent epimerase/dehydratase domain-containing protein n=1 Tax=Coniella lustricola TaxID=2025994 RepID=A0A2T3AEG5_9PEZI|nr:hypothetical protein BD289DRAFT_451496 [Coniella lustricola]